MKPNFVKRISHKLEILNVTQLASLLSVTQSEVSAMVTIAQDKKNTKF